jgi:outer membrane protein assembly factor BamB
MAAMAAVRGASRHARYALLSAGRRIRWRLLGGLFTCLMLAATAMIGLEAARRAVPVAAEQTTSSVPPPVLVDAGPPPGPLLAIWRIATDNLPDQAPQGGQVGAGLVDGQLVIASGAGLDVRDGRTGGARWHYYRKGWMLAGWAATPAEVAAFFERGSGYPAHVLVALDAATGRALWQSVRDRPVGVEPGALRWLSGPGSFLVSTDGRAVRAVAARTGLTQWSLPLPRRCSLSAPEPFGTGGDDITVDVLSFTCGAGQRLVAVNPVDGHVRWRLRPADAGATAVLVHGGTSVLWDGEALRVVGADGRSLLRAWGDGTCGDVCRVAVAGGRVLVVYSPGGRPEVLQAIDVRTGATVWRRPAAAYQAMTAVGDRVYALRSTLADGLLPAALDVIDPSDGHLVTVPLPLAFRPGAGGEPWLAAGGGLLYAGYPLEFTGPAGGYRVIALRSAPAGPGPTWLGGVPPGRWPDACSLLTSQDLAAAIPAAGYTSTPNVLDAGGGRLHVGCGYLPAQGDGGAADVDVSVGWVAATARGAAQLVADDLATYQQAERLPGLGDEAYEFAVPTGPVVVRVGRVVVTVRADRSPGAATELARAAVLRLRRDGF